MDCFAHSSAPAVACCKSCGRATCRACAKDLEFAVVCSDACAIEATEIHEMNRRGKRIYGIGATRKRFPMAKATWLAFAALFLGFGGYEFFAGRNFIWFPLLFGLLCLVLAVMSYRRVKEMQLNC